MMEPQMQDAAPQQGGMMPQGQQGQQDALPRQVQAMIISRLEGLNRMLEGMGLGGLTPEDTEQLTQQILQSLQQQQGGAQPGMAPPQGGMPPRPPMGGMQPPMGGGYAPQ